MKNKWKLIVTDDNDISFWQLLINKMDWLKEIILQLLKFLKGGK